MTDLCTEWVVKAEGDSDTALRENRVLNLPNLDAVCFHSQQCIEKYLKASLVSKGETVRHIHDLEVLLEQCLSHFPDWQSMKADAQLLTQYAVQFRYPGVSADQEQAHDAVAAMGRMRKVIRSGLKLE